MKTPLKRLTFAALTSSSVFAITWTWYQYAAETSTRDSSEKPLAYVGKVVDDIQRRPAQRLLWQGVNTGEPLFNGEAVRTSVKGEVRIQFADSERYLDLEPESLIVIKKSQNDIALDLMEGSLFVNSQNAGNEAGSLVLNSGKGQVDLSKASANLAKSSGDKIDVQVLAGLASMTDLSGKRNELTKGSSGLLGDKGFEFDQKQLKIILPQNLKMISIPADQPTPVAFQWQGFPPGSQVRLWLGDTRKGLRELATMKNTESSFVAAIPFGNHFWKLVAQDTKGKILAESPVYRTQVNPRYGASVVAPKADGTVIAPQLPMTVDLSWEKPEDIQSVALEVWSDERLTNKVVSRSFTKEVNFALSQLQAGTYFLRMTSYFGEGDAPLVGTVQKFSVKTEAQARKEQPVVPVNVFFTMPATENTQFFVESPKVNFTWSADKPENVAKWNLKIYSEEESPAKVEAIQVVTTKFSTPVKKSGRYLASVEALDRDGRIIGTTSSSAIVVAPLPLIKAPQFLPLDGVLQATMDGRTQLSWETVSGAKEYWLEIKKDGKILRRTKYTKNSTALKNLLPGNYEVTISAVDDVGRNSEDSKTRQLQVPDKSDIKAPTLKRIKVN